MTSCCVPSKLGGPTYDSRLHLSDPYILNNLLPPGQVHNINLPFPLFLTNMTEAIKKKKKSKNPNQIKLNLGVKQPW